MAHCRSAAARLAIEPVGVSKGRGSAAGERGAEFWSAKRPRGAASSPGRRIGSAHLGERGAHARFKRLRRGHALSRSRRFVSAASCGLASEEGSSSAGVDCVHAPPRGAAFTGRRRHIHNRCRWRRGRGRRCRIDQDRTLEFRFGRLGSTRAPSRPERTLARRNSR